MRLNGKEDLAMAKENAGKSWTDAQKPQLAKLADGNTPTGVIAMKMGRSEDAIRAKAHELDVSLKPVNQSPYNRRKS
jgi:hypothetical protein